MGNLFSSMSKYVSEGELSSDSESDFNVDNSADTKTTPSTSLNTADASLSKSVCLPDPQAIITLDKVSIIQKHLDEQDMISLVYLLFDQPLYALQEIALWRIEKDRQVLYEWASLSSGKGYIWKNQLLEALCILRNYHILKKLGYDKEHLINFLPHSPYATVYVNKLRKMLYIICEKLDSSKTEVLLEYVRKDYMHKSMELNEFNMDPIALELYLLYWESCDYIKQTNVENLMKAFKVMEEEQLYNILDSYHKSLQKPLDKQAYITSPEVGKPKKSARSQLGLSNEIPAVVGTSEEHASNLFHASLWDDPEEKGRRISTSVDNQQLNVRTDQALRVYRGLGDPESLETNLFEPTVEENNRFYINPENPGKILIINQEYFYTETMEQYRHLLPENSEQLERRIGTENDKMRLASTFKKFGFEPKIENDLKHMDMVDCIKKTVASITNESSLFVCILSHGNKGIVYGANSCRVPVSEIQDMICKPHLANKPKVLILQSCQGFQCFNLNDRKDQQEEFVESQSPLATDGATSLPHTANLLTFWATVPGYAAIRHKEKGSWFIQSLCEKVEAYQDKIHFLDICTRIRKDVAEKKWIKGAAEYKMCSEIQTTFLQDFFLPKMRL
ncbi:unnamed protein product [Callosobruchus maculatus]|uniref:Uncharacterized protein n=1 Tax=Callosobruchus maculatus TaxID=64391 RepID=A0A653BKU8_CALMS|nr:unnamed protein product [Callosobruchus maculatus]